MTTDSSIPGICARFQNLFGQSPRIYQAPGRVNLIGEHTDYNNGFVMPAAIGFYTWAAVSPRADRTLVARSENLNEQVEVSLDELPPQGKHHWSDYIVGVAKMLEASGRALAGANLLVYGNVPQGAGLSSSASLEVAVASALLGVTDKTADPKELALLCQRAENEYVGARCGIMDQFISAHGKRGQALMLDCRSLEYRLLPLPYEAHLVICNTMVRHSVATGEYNQRRAECEQGVRILARHRPGVKALRDLSLADLEEFRNELPPKVFCRCRHVISENARVLEAAGALERSDLKEIRILMHESHRSLQHDFEVSCPELDAMVHVAGQVKGVYGARMTGGGFGGCTVNLVAGDCVEAFREHVSKAYERLTKIVPEIYVCSAADGASRVA
jgi:galactokinase